MKQLYIFLALFIQAVFFLSCTGDNKTDNSWERERDSLIAVNGHQQMLIDEMTSTMAEISMGLDSIANHERMIVRRVDEFGNPLNKRALKEKLSALAEMVQGMREKMEAIQATMENGKLAIEQLKRLIEHLNNSLIQKEQEIEELRAEIDSKNVNIARLNSHLASIKDTVAIEREEHKIQTHALETQLQEQDEALNEVFYIIGTKEQLISSGVLSKSGIIFKKVKINLASMDKSVLTRADKRTLKCIEIRGKSPKILSEEPKGSYSLDKGSATSTLTILDSEKFWNTNNRILVIQIK